MLGVLLRVGGHGRETSSGWWVLEPLGAAGLLGAVVVLGWAVVGAIRADDARGRPLAPPLRVLGRLGWGVVGVVVAVVALAWW